MTAVSLFAVMLLSCVVLAAAAAAAAVADAATGCQSIFPGYHVNREYDALIVGCYKSNGNIFPPKSLVNFRGAIVWDNWAERQNAKNIVQKCGPLALELGAKYFGVEHYGKCYFADTPNLSDDDLVTPADGCDDHCKWDVGGHGAMVVYRLEKTATELKPCVCQSVHIAYRLNNQLWAVNQGCYHSDDSNHHMVLPSATALNFEDEIDWTYYLDRGHAFYMIRKCGLLALERGMTYFGVEGYGICYFGNSPNYSLGPVTEEDHCFRHCMADVGTYGVMVVYKIQTL